jgi:hypothetical protein
MMSRPTPRAGDVPGQRASFALSCTDTYVVANASQRSWSASSTIRRPGMLPPHESHHLPAAMITLLANTTTSPSVGIPRLPLHQPAGLPAAPTGTAGTPLRHPAELRRPGPIPAESPGVGARGRPAATTAGPRPGAGARTRRRRRRRGRSLARGGCPPRRSGLGCVGGPGSSAVKVAAPAAAVRLGLELALKLHQAPDLSAVGTDVRLDLGGQLSGGGQVDAEQLRAALQRRRDRPAQVGLVPSPHRGRVLEHRFEEEATDHLRQLPDEVDTALRIPHPAAIAIRSEPGSPSAGGHALCVSGFRRSRSQKGRN